MTYLLLNMFLLIPILAFTNAGLLTVATKWGWIEHYEVHCAKRKILKFITLPEKCFYCLSFWLSMVEILMLCLTLDLSFEYLLAAFAAAFITVMLR